MEWALEATAGRSRRRAAWLLLAGLLGACAPRSPAEVPVASGSEATPPPPPPPLPPPPPPPPPCESLEEQCEATDATRARIPPLNATFAPPAGWIYAQEPAATLAHAEAKGAALAITSSLTSESGDILAAVRALVERLDLEDLREDGLKRRLAKPEARWDAGGTPARLWEIRKGGWPQIKDPSRGGESGAALLAVIEFGPEQVVVALAFQAHESEGEPEAVKAALESVRAP